jgi:hypothetical protein
MPAVRLVEIMSLSPFLKLVIWSGLNIRPIRRFGINAHDRKQWQAEITHFPEQAIQLRPDRPPGQPGWLFRRLRG